jgi:hypothetical protein
MAAVPFDTLKRARRLEAARFPTQQAGDMAEGIAEALSELATKADIAALRADTKADITGLRADIELLRRDIELAKREMTIRLGGMIVIAVGVLLAAMRYFTLHP